MKKVDAHCLLSCVSVYQYQYRERNRQQQQQCFSNIRGICKRRKVGKLQYTPSIRYPCRFLLDVSKALDVPSIATEQYPKVK